MMSDSEEELEGDVEEIEGDDLWGAFEESNTSTRKGEENIESPPSDVQKISVKDIQHSSGSKDKTLMQETSQVCVAKSPEQLVRDTDSYTKSKHAVVEVAQHQDAQGSSTGVSPVGDIASAITNIDAEQSAVGVKGKSEGSKETSRPKRKPSESVSSSLLKMRKVEAKSNASPNSAKDSKSQDSGRNVFAAVEEKFVDKESKTVDISEHTDDSVMMINEEDSKAIDTTLVEAMFENAKKHVRPRTDGITFRLRFSPVEIADLADTSMQDFIRSQPNLSFCFKRQAGKFKKKKGYGEICLMQPLMISTFLRKLMQVKLTEDRIEISIAVHLPTGKSYVGGFVLWLNKSHKLLKLIGLGDDLVRGSQKETKTFLELKQVPIDAHPLSLKTIFPCTPFIDLRDSVEHTTSKPAYKGPIYVCYPNANWLEAVYECCTDFSYNGCPLVINYSAKTEGEKSTHAETDVGREDPAPDLVRRSSVQSNSDEGTSPTEGQEHSSEDRHAESIPDNPAPEEDRGDTAEGEKCIETEEGNEDDDISSMTRDVCADMLESLNKLKQLETDNPNVQKILEMQEQLSKLQKSLCKANHGKTLVAEKSEQEENPWAIASSDMDKESLDEATIESKQVTKKEVKEKKGASQAEKQRLEMESIQKMIDDANEAEKQREEMSRQMRETELKAMKEFEEKRRASWAKKMIEDLKKGKLSGTADGSATRKEAQKLLMAREEKLRQQKEADTEKVKPAQGAPSEAKTDSELSIGNLKEGIAQIILPFQEMISSSSSEGKSEKILDLVLHGQSSSSQTTVTEASKKSETLPTASSSGTVQTANPDSSLETKEDPQEPAVEVTEEFYKEMMSGKRDTPQNYKVSLKFYENRGCPVPGCPAKRFFKTKEDFVAHWQIFHQQNMTVRFCLKCSAYFAHKEELQGHLETRHAVQRNELGGMLQKVRTKVIRNPSYRDPGCFSYSA